MRISLQVYRALAEVNNEDELETCRQGLSDRFGPLPQATERLLQTKKLIWAGRNLGFEKVVYKDKKLVGYFVGDKASPFYESAVFEAILRCVQRHPEGAQLRERNERLSPSFGHCATLEKAVATLDEVVA